MVDDHERFGIEELAERGGVTRRTVRYYIQRGLLPPPLGLGRGKHYSDEHLEMLIRIRELQEAGVPLAELPQRLGRLVDDERPIQTAASTDEPEQSTWVRVVLSDALEIHLRGRRLSPHQLCALRNAITLVIGEDEP